MVVQELFRTTSQGEAIHWNFSYYLFEKLSNNPSLLNENKLMADFYIKLKDSPIAALHTIESKMSDVLEPSQEDKNAITGNIQERKVLSEQLEGYDASLQAAVNEIEKEKLIALISLNTIKLTDIYSNHENLLKKIEATRLSKIERIREENSSIQTSNMFEANLKAYNDVYMSTLLSNKTTHTDVEEQQIQAIAFQCEYDGGLAVWKARALYEMWTNHKFKVEDFCSDSQGKARSSNIITSKKAEDIIKISPNPAMNELIINISTTDKNTPIKGIIYSSTGSVVMEKDLGQEANLLNISSLLPGFYLCKILQGNNFIDTQKVMVIK